MAKGLRPRTLAAGFGVYFLVIGFASWGFAQGLANAWFLEDITRWVYTTYMLVAAIFLVGLGGLGLAVRRSFTRQIHELDRRAASHNPMQEAMPPPLPETVVAKDHVDRDIDELLESLSEIEATTVQEAAAMDMGVAPAPPLVVARDPAVQAQRERLVQRSKQLGRFVLGPGVVAAIILGISGMMLPGSDGFAQYQHQLNTALILGIGYSWAGVGGYIAATVYALSSGREPRRKR